MENKPALGNPLPAPSRILKVATNLNLKRRGAPGSGCQASNVLQEMNSLGIKRGEGSRQFGELLLLVIPHLISLSILMIWGVWDKSPFSTPLMEPIHPFLGALIVSPFIILSLIAYVVFASIFLIVFRLTATRMSTVKRNVLTAFLSGISVFGILTQYWSHIP